MESTDTQNINHRLRYIDQKRKHTPLASCRPALSCTGRPGKVSAIRAVKHYHLHADPPGNVREVRIVFGFLVGPLKGLFPIFHALPRHLIVRRR